MQYNHIIANAIIIGYTTSAIAGNGIGQIYAAGWLTTFAHDHLEFISQNPCPSQSMPYAFAVRYHALIVATIAKRIIIVNFFMR